MTMFEPQTATVYRMVQAKEVVPDKRQCEPGYRNTLSMPSCELAMFPFGIGPSHCDKQRNVSARG